tara:strand:- start:157 stop:318 length:162 start_codon:yes stop_codon:yes gene_type:complete
VDFYKELETGSKEDTQGEKLAQKHMTLHMMSMSHDCQAANVATAKASLEVSKV